MIFISKKDEPRLSQAIEYISLLDDSKDWEISVKPYKKSLTANQRNYWHDLLGIISTYTGYDKEDLKTRMCHTLGYVRNVRLKSGEIIRERKSTETLTREEYSKLIEAAQMACLELGLKYPEPEQYDVR